MIKTDDQRKACEIAGQPEVTRLLLYGGSRSGKSFITIRNIIIRAAKCESRHALLRYHFNHAKQSLWYDTIPAVFKSCFPELRYTENKSDWFIRLGNGSEIWLGGLDDKERTEKILGNEYSTIYFNEISQISWPAVVMALTRLAQKTELKNMAYFDCNPPSKKHWSYQIWFEGKHPETKAAIKNPESYVKLKMNPEGNRVNIASGYIENTLGELTGHARDRFLLGEYTDDLSGALWNSDMICNFRVMESPILKRIVVAIDPAVTSKPDSDETGIIVAGKGVDNHYYILSDRSGIYTPDGWAKAAVSAYHEWKADRVIGEVNNGGDMIEAMIRNYDRNVSYKKVTASRGKVIRAEPIVALYEKGQVHHVGELPGLEDQQTTWRPAEDGKSPDRIDALVWAVTELMGSQFFVV